MKLEKLQPGMVVYDVHSTRMGNTTLRTLGVWLIRIVSIDADRRTCVASWNGNTPRTYYESEISKWKAEEPYLVRSGMGYLRRPTREEAKAHREKQRALAAKAAQGEQP